LVNGAGFQAARIEKPRPGGRGFDWRSAKQFGYFASGWLAVSGAIAMNGRPTM
jgi:hypothetical protein